LSTGSVPTFYNVNGPTLENVRDIAVSNEGPQSRSLFVLTNNELYKVTPSDNSVIGPLAAPREWTPFVRSIAHSRHCGSTPAAYQLGSDAGARSLLASYSF
jgi:hypothetical protein